MCVIGITGGVGSGKSTVLEILNKKYNATIYQADQLAHDAYEPETKPYQEIVEHFGSGILNKNNRIDRTKLAEILFHDEKEKEYINRLIHPFVLDKIKSIINEWKNNTEKIKANQTIEKVPDSILVIETALMYETGCDRLCDFVIGITCDESIRIQRLIETRGYTKEKCKAIIQSQISDAELYAKCDYQITNNRDIDELETQTKDALKYCQKKMVES